MINKDIETARKCAKMQTAVIAGMNSAPSMAGIDLDHTTFKVRLDVDMKHPGNASGYKSALSQIVTSVVSHFPNMRMSDVLEAVINGLERNIWEHPHMGGNMKNAYLSQVGTRIRSPFNSISYESRVTDYDQNKKNAAIRQERASMGVKQIREENERQKLCKKYSYMDDIDTFSLEELREIDNYTKDLKGNVKL